MRYLKSLKTRVAVALMGAATSALIGAGVAGATETATEEKLKTVATQVGTEGVNVVLVILGAITALIVAVIVIPKAVGLIKRFI